MLRVRAALGDRRGHHRQQESGLEDQCASWAFGGLPGPKKRPWNPANEATEEDLVERRFARRVALTSSL